MMLLGIAAWVYRVIWRDGFARGRRYRVSGVTIGEDVTTVELDPVGRPLRHHLGQFAFIRIGTRGLSEPHPFTIASHPHDRRLRFHVKDLGDWSGRLGAAVEPGMVVRVEGPHGRLHVFPPAGRSDVPVVWVAGGVGITPFLGAVASCCICASPAKAHDSRSITSATRSVMLDWSLRTS
jgi:predicted ferric reductase